MKYLFILLFFSSFSYSQDFKNDWKDFKTPQNWTIEFENHISPLLGKNVMGIISFNNKKDLKKKILYYIFDVADIDEIFTKKIEHWYFVQSCLIEIGNNKPFQATFKSKNYFYTIMPCYQCKTSTNEDCSELADEISKFASSKNKWSILNRTE